MTLIKTRNRLVVTALAATLALLPACGSTPKSTLPTASDTASNAAGSTSPTADAPNEAAQADAFARFKDCLSQHGIKPVHPGEAPAATEMQMSQEERDAAFAACDPIMKDAGIQPLQGGIPADMKQKLLGLAKCMRGKGYDFPDPEFDQNGGFRVAAPQGPNVQKDQSACQRELGLDLNSPGTQGTP